MNWTDDQKNSIFAKPARIVVSAAAGSGKTQVLTSRIIERIKSTDSPVSVEKLLVVTFTKAAAAEMKERIGKALRKAVNETENPEEKKYLKSQLSLLGGAHICTIDSFCYDIVKQNFYKVNLPSDISIGEAGELSLLKLSALEEAVNALYCALEKKKGSTLTEENEECAAIVEKYFPDKAELSFILDGFEALTNSFSYDKRDSEFSENIKGAGDYTTMISELYKKAQSAAYPEKWLQNAAEAYNNHSVPFEKTFIYEYIVKTCQLTLENASDAIAQLAEVAEINNTGNDEFLREEAETLLEFSRLKDYSSLYNFFNSTTLFSTIKGKKTDCDKEIKSRITSTRASIRAYTRDVILKKFLSFSPEEWEALRQHQYPQVKALCSAAILLDKIYYDKMTSRRIIDFSACEHLALKIISEDSVSLTDAGEAIKQKYDEIYIDEFQDSNELQDTLFSLISKGRSFMVGDVKQSIYGFRNSDPTIFMQKCDDSSLDAEAEKRKIFLSKNFRSAASVLDGVNSIFDIVMTLPSCGIDYKAEHRLDFGADFMPINVTDDKCELIILSQNSTADEQRSYEAICIADKIKEIMSSGRQVWDKDENRSRPVRYSDIVVLSRSLKPVASSFEMSFSEKGIPFYVDGSNDLYETTEVRQILELLKLIDNAQSDISLACTLRSPMFMFDENELLRIKLAGTGSFCDAFYGICSSKYKTDSTLAKKCRSFMQRLRLWREASGFVSIEELIRRIYSDTNIYSSVLSFPDGQLRRANLDLLLEKAEEFERSTYSGLFNFVNYIQKIKKTAEVTSEAKSISEKMDVVRIMTVHKSKGLEFPIVFLAGCGNAYSTSKAKAGGLIISSRGGIGIDVINPLLRSRYKSPVQIILSNIEATENAREEMRLLYVSLTRAREKLYAVGSLKNPDKFDESRMETLCRPTANEILSANSYLTLMSLSFGRGAERFWEVSYKDSESLPLRELSAREESIEFKENSAISNLLDYSYPYMSSVFLPNKASVSFLKSLDINLAPAEDGNIPMLSTPSCKKIALKKPDFINKEVGGTFFGTVHHKFLQYVDYSGEDSLEEQCKKLLDKGILSKDEYSAIRLDKIEEFISSSLGQMLKEAEEIHREEPFVISVDAREINPSLPESSSICIQGIIDCYFEYDGKIILLDYKTDSYSSPSEIAEKYAKQLYFYEKALKTKFNNKVIEKYLYLMHKNDIIKL